MAKKILNTMDSGTFQEALNVIAMCIEGIFDQECLYSNLSIKEISDWLENLTQPYFEKIQEFFETMPKLKHKIVLNCGKCGNTTDYVIEGLSSFFE